MWQRNDALGVTPSFCEFEIRRPCTPPAQEADELYNNLLAVSTLGWVQPALLVL